MHLFNNEFIDFIKNNAKKYSWNIEKDPIAPVQTMFSDVTYKNETFNLVLTFNIYKNNLSAWQLTINQTKIKNKEIVPEIVKEILGDNSQKIPDDLFPKELQELKQYFKMEENYGRRFENN